LFFLAKWTNFLSTYGLSKESIIKPIIRKKRPLRIGRTSPKTPTMRKKIPRVI
jgi:hypothetical protein